MRLPFHSTPNDIIAQCNLCALASDVWIYLDIRNGMPCFKQAGLIANDRLTLHLAKHGYVHVHRTPSLWSHVH